MLVSCPACAARYRLDPARIVGKRVSIRCPACQFVFVFPQKEQLSVQDPEVLFATGSSSLSQALAERCRQNQMAFVACSDGNEALQLLANGLPTTVLLDVALTGRYAFDVIKFVRSQPRGGEIRILLLTSSFRRGSFVAKATELHGANDSIDGVVLSGMENEEFRRFLTTGVSASDNPGPPAEPTTLGEKTVELTPTQWNQASTLAKVIVADIVLRYQDLLEESARTGLLGKTLVEGLAKGRQIFSARMGEDLARKYDFVGAALAACLQGGTSNPSYDADE